MQVDTILQSKGRAVATISARLTVADAATELNTRKIGAVVVTENGRVAGILSERDIVRHLGKDWASLATRPVADIMTRDVVTVGRFATVDEVMELMTARRIRHLPIVEAGELVGIVSIGDVVKYRIDQLTDERNHLLGYLHT